MKRATVILAAIVAVGTALSAQSIPVTWSGVFRRQSKCDARDMRHIGGSDPGAWMHLSPQITF